MKANKHLMHYCSPRVWPVPVTQKVLTRYLVNQWVSKWVHLLFPDKCTPADRYNDWQGIKEERLETGVYGLLWWSSPDSPGKAEAGLGLPSMSAALPEAQKWGVHRSGLELVKVGNAHSPQCSSLQMAWSYQPGQGFLCLLLESRLWGERGLAHLWRRESLGHAAALSNNRPGTRLCPRSIHNLQLGAQPSPSVNSLLSPVKRSHSATLFHGQKHPGCTYWF